jgi:hypothetical protein
VCEQALSIARTPPPFVANYCFAADGTAKVFRTVEWWHHLWPSNHTISDDIRNMYNEVSRPAAFTFLRKRFPELLPVARLFYGSGGARIWFNDELIRGSELDECLRCERGFAQGCALATLLSIGAYHKELAVLQRRHPGLRIVCDADNTCTSTPQGRRSTPSSMTNASS